MNEAEANRIKRALTWCAERFATARFISVYGKPRVRVCPGGGFDMERDTLVEAVEAYILLEEQAKCAEERHKQILEMFRPCQGV